MTRKRGFWVAACAAFCAGQNQTRGNGMDKVIISDKLSRRSAARLIVGSIGLSVLAACGVNTPTNPPTVAPQPAAAPTRASQPTVLISAPAPTPATGGLPKTGGTLRIGVPTDIVTLDP